MHVYFRRCNKLERFSVAKRYLVLISRICALLIGGIALIAFANVCAYAFLKPALPDVDSLRDIQLQVPLRIYTRDGRLIASMGEQQRIPVRYEQIPKLMVQAFLAAEDDRFFQHHGIDWQGILRAALKNLRAGGVRQGGSTITQQVARDMFLNPRERDMKRKISEVYISFLMEAEFSKEEIFSLFANKTFLGERAYGVGAAAEVYYGKSLDQLSIAEMATIAGIPSAPSTVNPVAGPEKARARRAYVLGRMLALGYITQAEYEHANASPIETRLHGPSIEVDAPNVAEMVRADMLGKYGDAIYTAGYRVYTTIDSRLERDATIALRTGLLQYDRRHGWRGATAKLALAKNPTTASLDAELDQFPVIGGLKPAIVLKAEGKSAEIFVKSLGIVTLPWDKLSWARRELPEENTDRTPLSAAEIFARGDVIYTVGNTAENLQFVQVPDAQSALVSLDPRDGAIVALVGGFDFFQSKFNRVTQAKRQPGSSFKPFLYAAAFEKGYTPASVILDAPVVLGSTAVPGAANGTGQPPPQAWRPKDNNGEKFFGPMRLRDALVYSRNLVSVRLMQDIGLEYVRDYVTRFGFDKSQLPDDLTLAIGTAEASPLQMATAYATFANGGFKITPYYIDRIENASGESLLKAEPQIACSTCALSSEAAADGAPPGAAAATVPSAGAVPAPPSATRNKAAAAQLDTTDHDGKSLIPAKDLAPQVLRPQIAYVLTDMMRDVIRRGTGVHAQAVGRDDIAGKTGTTNDAHDAWFSGFNGALVTSVWVGFDQDRSLGAREEGGRTAVPIWTYFMHDALAGTPMHRVPMPEGVVTARINPDTGQLASSDDPKGIMEMFVEGNLPKPELYEGPNTNDSDKPLF
jgi:penicillin-binding protein 1A